jgi:hypothetical protein
MTDWSTTDARLGRDAHPPDEPTPDDRGDRVAVAPDGGAGGWEAFDDPDAPAPPATTPDRPEPHRPTVTPPPTAAPAAGKPSTTPTPRAASQSRTTPRSTQRLGELLKATGSISTSFSKGSTRRSPRGRSSPISSMRL